ncbi:MAG: GNAT family N-acetyltransferase [Acidimicrobiales bacterium]|nr:GNAT family N-acetyltransferase [Acidimicrobiales bacterium]
MKNRTDVRLRPVAGRDLEHLERFDRDASLSEPYEWRGFGNTRAHPERWEKDGYLTGYGSTEPNDESLLVVELGGETFAGIVSFRSVDRTGARSCLKIGILLLPGHRAQGIGATAQALRADYLFTHTIANRLEALTEADNVAEQRALELAGFTREGVLRGRGFARGAWRDAVVYGRVRSDAAPNN